MRNPEKKSAIKTIKRYSNRKLYDTARSKYVTLEEIAEMIKAGEEVRIIDNKSKVDLTSATLAQIIFETEKKERRMPLAMLRNLIQSGGDALGDFWDRSVRTPVETAAHSAQKTAEEIRQSAQQLKDAATRGIDEFTVTARRVFGRGETEIVDKKVDAIARRYEAAFEDLKKRLDLQIREAPDDGSNVIEPLIERLSQRLEEVKRQLRELHSAAFRLPDAPEVAPSPEASSEPPLAEVSPVVPTPDPESPESTDKVA